MNTYNDDSCHLMEQHILDCALESTWLLRVHQYGLKEARRMQDEDESVDMDWIEIDEEDGRKNFFPPTQHQTK